MNMKQLFARSSAVLLSLAASASAMANTTGTGALGSASATDAFDAFRDTVVTWARGPLGTGLAVTMMLMGAGMGVARNSPMPALSGVAGAAFLNWGPGIIMSLTEGALI